MSYVTTDDGVKLYYEDSGSGLPIVFVHEFAGDHRSWEPQIRYFSRNYRCIVYAARGYPPSDVPAQVEKYSQARATDDIAAIIHGLGAAPAQVIGLSMGGYATLHLGMRHPALVRSMVIAGCGWGSTPVKSDAPRQQAEANAKLFETSGGAAAAEAYANVPSRWSFRKKDPRGWAEFMARLAEHSPVGSALTMRGVQARRPSLWDLIEPMRKVAAPTLIVTGDDDDPCLEPGLLMKRTIPHAGLLVLPRGGHAINLEEPAAFNRSVEQFLHAAERGRWTMDETRPAP